MKINRREFMGTFAAGGAAALTIACGPINAPVTLWGLPVETVSMSEEWVTIGEISSIAELEDLATKFREHIARAYKIPPFLLSSMDHPV